MKTFRFLMMTVATVVLAGFMSCNNNDDILPNGGNDGTLGDTYFSISLSIPNDASSSNAPAFKAPSADTPEDSGEQEAGTGNEIVVTKVDLYFFNATTGIYLTTMSFTQSEIANPIAQGKNHLVTSVVKGVNLAKNAAYDVCVLINHNTIGTLTGVSIGDFQKTSMLAPVASFSGGFVPLTAAGLPMAGRTYDGTDRIPPVRITITNNNTITNPVVLKLDAERSVAKLMLTPVTTSVGKNKYEITDGAATPSTIATAELEEYTVVNLMNTGFAFRHAVEEGDVLTPTSSYFYGNIVENIHYVMDPQTHNKQTSVIGTLPATIYSQPASATSRVYKTMAVDHPADNVIGYCYENTTDSINQKNGYSTGLVFKMKITPVEIWQLDGVGDCESVPFPAGLPVFYYSNGRFYMNLATIAKEKGIAETALPTTADELKALSIETLTNGYCYYNYWIKHYDNGSDKMGMMEFGIVRNNLYKMSISRIRAIGSGIDVIVPEEDDEIALSYITVEMSILPWIVRDNEGIVL